MTTKFRGFNIFSYIDVSCTSSLRELKTSFNDFGLSRDKINRRLCFFGKSCNITRYYTVCVYCNMNELMP